MTAVAAGLFPVRVMVTEVWDHVELQAGPETTVAELKRRALAEALGSAAVDPDVYQVKFHGAAVLDEWLTLRALGAGPNAPFIVMLRRRRPVR